MIKHLITYQDKTGTIHNKITSHDSIASAYITILEHEGLIYQYDIVNTGDIANQSK